MIGEKGFAYNAGSDEFGVIQYETAEKTYKVGDKLELIVPHCDPVVNEYRRDPRHSQRSRRSGVADLARGHSQ